MTSDITHTASPSFTWESVPAGLGQKSRGQLARLIAHEDQRAARDFAVRLHDLSHAVACGRKADAETIVRGFLPDADGRLFERMWVLLELMHPPSVVVLEKPSEVDLDQIAQNYRIDRDSITSILMQFQATNAIYHSLYPQLSDVRHPADYQRELLRQGAFSMLSPFSSRQLMTNTSFIIRSMLSDEARNVIFYHFRDGERAFCVAADQLHGDLVALYLYDENVLISTSSRVRVRTDDISQLKALFAAEWEGTCEYISRSEERSVAVVSGVLNHLGHTLLNEFEAFHQCALAGLFDNVAYVLEGWASFFNCVDVFPELKSAKTEKLQSSADFHQLILANNVIVVRPLCRSYWISSGLRRRFELFAEFSPGSIRSSEPVDAMRDCFPILYLDLRSNNRYWEGQNEGYSLLIKRLSAKFPRLGVVLAGWSTLDGGPVGAREGRLIGLDQDRVHSISSQVGASAKIFSIVGCSIAEKFLWSRFIDVFVGVYSSGILIPSGLANKPGVIFGSSHFQKMIIKNMKTGIFPYIEGGTVNHFIGMKHIADIPGSGRGGNVNYQVDWEELERGVGKLLESIDPRDKSAHPDSVR